MGVSGNFLYLICILEQSIDSSFIIITSLIHMEAHWTLLLRTWLVERSLLGQLLFLLAQKTHTEQMELRKKRKRISHTVSYNYTMSEIV